MEYIVVRWLYKFVCLYITLTDLMIIIMQRLQTYLKVLNL